MKPIAVQITAGVLLAALLMMTTGCAATRSAGDSLDAIRYPAESPPSGAIVFLPGFGDSPERFERKGFTVIASEHAPMFELIAVDAHFGFYRAGTVLDRLYEDVLLPLDAAGVDEIWLVGISMGGAGALGTAAEYPELVDGVVALAPYLGPRDIIEEIEAAGGLAAWEPGDLSELPDDRRTFFLRQWAWLRGYALGEPRPPLVFGVGTGDRLASVVEMAAEAVGPDALLTAEGAHNWRVWTPLFAELVPRIRVDSLSAAAD